MHLKSIIPIHHEDTNIEIMARIVKAASHKYNCDVEIDFGGGQRKVIFTGDDEMKPYIAEEVLDIFESKEGETCKR
jgi:hypothetical protein